MRTLKVPRLQTLPSDLRRLHRDGERMPREVRDATLCSVVNDISHIMHWDFVPLCRYEQSINRLVLTGFPTLHYPHYYRINERQVRYLLHKMDFTHATIYTGSTGDTMLVLQHKHHHHKPQRGHRTFVERVDPWHMKYKRKGHEPNNPMKHEHNYENILTRIDNEAEHREDRFHSYDPHEKDRHDGGRFDERPPY